MKKLTCFKCSENHTELHNAGANKFQIVNPPLVYSNKNPHDEDKQQQKLTMQEIKQIHKQVVEKNFMRCII